MQPMINILIKTHTQQQNYAYNTTKLYKRTLYIASESVETNSHIV